MVLRWDKLLLAGGIGSACLYAADEVRRSSLVYPRVALASSKEETRKTLSVPYLLIGGGTASYYAALTIRGRDADAKVLILGDEPYSCYNKTNLSKELWWQNIDPSDPYSFEYTGFRGRKKHVAYEADGFYIQPEKINEFPHGCVSLMRGVSAVKLDLNKKVVLLSDGREIGFEKLLIATGSSPVTQRALDKPELQDNVIHLSKLDDYVRLRKSCKPGAKVVVIDGGFLGTELSFSLKHAVPGLEVVQVSKHANCLQDVLPKELAIECSDSVDSTGVRLIRNARVEAAQKMPDGRVHLKLATDRGTCTVAADLVVDGLHWKPNVDLAKDSGLELDPIRQGILVNAEFEARKNVFVAGDIASFYDPVLGRMRIQHLEHAEITGRCAGHNMTDGSKTLPRRAAFRSRVGELLFLEGVGRTESALKTTVVRAENGETGLPRWVVFYTHKERIVGVLTCNVSYSMEFARKLIEDAKPNLDLKEVAKLFNLYKSDQPQPEALDPDRHE